jgi:hypothetical protein
VLRCSLVRVECLSSMAQPRVKTGQPTVPVGQEEMHFGAQYSRTRRSYNPHEESRRCDIEAQVPEAGLRAYVLLSSPHSSRVRPTPRISCETRLNDAGARRRALKWILAFRQLHPLVRRPPVLIDDLFVLVGLRPDFGDFCGVGRA